MSKYYAYILFGLLCIIYGLIGIKYKEIRIGHTTDRGKNAIFWSLVLLVVGVAFIILGIVLITLPG